MAYIITNKSGNRCGVSEKRYYELIDQEGYTGEITESKISQDYTIAELRDMKDDIEDWDSFIAGDSRKSVTQI